MERMYEKEWFGIPFSRFARLDPKEMAGISFYDKFYDEFYKKFSSYDDLPLAYRQKKGAIADFLVRQMKGGARNLSVGCGIGYIESVISMQGRNVVAIEPSVKASRFLKGCPRVKVLHGYFPDCLESAAEEFDLIYCVDTDYVFERDDLVSFIKAARSRSRSFIIVGIYRNGSVLRKVKEAAKQVLSRFGVYERGQFWGYLRNPEELAACFREAGYAEPEIGFLDDSSFWVRGDSSHREKDRVCLNTKS